MISVFCKKKRLEKLKNLRDSLSNKYGSDHFVVQALDARISNIKLFWWVGV